MKSDEIKNIFEEPVLRSVITGSDKDIEVPEKQFLENLFIEENQKHVPSYLDALSKNRTSSLNTTCRRLFKSLKNEVKRRNLLEVYGAQISKVEAIYKERSEELLRKDPNAARVLQAAKEAKLEEWRAVCTSIVATYKQSGMDLSFYQKEPINDLQAQNRRNIERFHARSIERALPTAKELDELRLIGEKLVLICQALDKDGADFRALGLEFRDTLRTALSNPAYQFICTDETNPYVHFLHQMAFAIFCNPEVVPAYLSFVSKSKSSGEAKAPNTLREALQQAYEPIVSRGSEEIDAFESAEDAANETNCGRLFEEVLEHYSVTHVVGPSQAKNGRVDPIFEAILQAIENRHFQKIENDPTPYYSLILTNMQNFLAGEEKENSISLMKLNERYPFSIKAATVSYHSPYVTEPTDPTLTDEARKQLVYEQLIADRNFLLTTENRGRYYLPSDQKEEWKKCIKKIVDLASVYIGPLNNEKQISNFYQLIKRGVVSAHKARSIKALQASDLPEKYKVLSFVVCHAGVDRAGATNAGILWTTAGVGSEKLAADFLVGRSVLSRDRLVYNGQREQLAMLSEDIPKEKVQTFLELVTEFCKAQES